MNRRTRHPRRSGYVLVAVLVAATVVLGVAAASLRGTTMARQRSRMDWRRVQLDRLVEAGRWRAEQWIQDQPDVQSERWTIPIDAVGGHGDVEYRIEVDRESDSDHATLTIQWNHVDGVVTRKQTLKIPSSLNREDS